MECANCCDEGCPDCWTEFDEEVDINWTIRLRDGCAWIVDRDDGTVHMSKMQDVESLLDRMLEIIS